jgi:hypothetical protein
LNSYVRTAVVLATTTALVTTGALSASAHHRPTHGAGGELASGLVTPLGLAVGSEGTVYVGETFAGQLTTVDKRGQQEVLVAGRGMVSGVDARGKGTAVFLAADMETGVATLERVQPNGKTRVVARLDDYERDVNPDQVNTYGFFGLTAACAAQLEGVVPVTGAYQGEVDSNPYAVAIIPGGYAVADAGGNSILRVGNDGRVSTIAVLPPQEPLVIDAEFLAAFNEGAAMEPEPGPRVPDCVIGATYVGEPVPTDVELGPDGMLYVTTLPGFPELPGTGSVYRIDPGVEGGNPQQVYTGFSGATDLAVAPDGTVYVAELFGGRVSRATSAGPVTVAELPTPAAVEWSGGQLYVAYDAFPPAPAGKVAVLQP